MSQDVRLEAPKGTCQYTRRPTVKVASPQVTHYCSNPTEWNACPTSDHKQVQGSFPVCGHEILTDSHFRSGAWALIKSRPIFLVPSDHYRQCRNHSHQRRIDSIKFKTGKLPMT